MPFLGQPLRHTAVFNNVLARGLGCAANDSEPGSLEYVKSSTGLHVTLGGICNCIPYAYILEWVCLLIRLPGDSHGVFLHFQALEWSVYREGLAIDVVQVSPVLRLGHTGFL